MYYRNKELVRVSPKYAENGTQERRNLIRGLPIFAIESEEPLMAGRADPRVNYNTDSTLLTDGVYAATPAYTDEQWFHITGAKARAITFELPHICAIDGFKLGICRSDMVAVRTPRFVSVRVSEDGVSFSRVFFEEKLHSARDLQRFDLERSIEPTRARYVQFVIDSLQHLYIDEIELFGCDDVSGAKSAVIDELPVFPNLDHPPIVMNRYPSVDELGAKNILLSYNCRPESKNGGLATFDDYLPYVAYLGSSGEVLDTFFDGFLFLPYTAYNFSARAQCADGWRFYLDNVFAPKRNLDALNETTAFVADKLGLAGLKNKVYFSILYTFTAAETFGVVDGRTLRFLSIEDRKAALKWLIDEYLRRFDEGGYESLELEAFYWFEEQITYSDAHEEELIAFVRDYVHQKGYKLFWIPYFKAVGYHDWKRLGFDVACMQPNYAFSDKIEASRVYDCAAIAKELGMCVELEITGIRTDENGIVTNPKDLEKFGEYLDIGAETGYMKTIKMYYQGGIPGDIGRGAASTDEKYRKLYEKTYKFSKEEL